MKKLTKILPILICCLMHAKAWAHENYKEYGIVLILPKEYYAEAQKMNKEIAAQVPKMANLPNVFHITLFQGCFSKNKIGELYKELKNQNFKKIKIEFEPKIKVAQNRYINWQVKKSEELKNLHNSVVAIANPYHQAILARHIDSYKELTKKQQQQVDAYGMPGLLEEYDPHTTLFYFSQKNSEIKNLAKKISPPKFTKELSKREITSMAIAELGYNGNIKKVLYAVELE